MKIKKIIKLILSIILLWFFIHSIVISIDGLSSTKSKADIGVVLGNKVNEDGTLSIRLQKSLDCGLRLCLSHPTVVGHVTEGNRSPLSKFKGGTLITFSFLFFA